MATLQQHGVLQPWGTSWVLGSLLWVPLVDSIAFASCGAQQI